MAHIKLQDLVLNNASESGSFIQDLLQCELALEGGNRRSAKPILPPPILSDWPTPIDPSFDEFLPPFANFYI